MTSWICSIWERRGIRGKLGWLFLVPFSWIYRIAVQLRNLWYRAGWIRLQALDRPVISVGNLTVGGTGKTPTCIWLAQQLTERGFKVSILSGGYKRKESRPVILVPEDKALNLERVGSEILAAGDEPFLMARMYGQTIAIGKNRYEAAREVLRGHEVDVFILDDGFQHRRLKRDVDLLLLGSDVSGRMLPCGPFREPRKAARRADFLLTTGAHEQWQRWAQSRAPHGIYSGALKAAVLIGFESHRWKEYPLSLLHRSRILAVSGIAHPSSFYSIIHEWEGEIVDSFEFRDHHVYTSADWQQINRRGHNADIILTTEKDLVKLIRFPFARDKLLALRVGMVVQDGAQLVQALIERIGSKS